MKDKNLDIEVGLKESFYQECASSQLPIPFSSEDLVTMINGAGISMMVIADNLLQIVDEHPERIGVYTPLIVYSCLNIGGEAAKEGDHTLSNHYFLLASDFAPDDIVVLQHLVQYKAAIDNYGFALQNPDRKTSGLL